MAEKNVSPLNREGLSFNILEQPWIPVIYTDGRIREVSLNECLKEAGIIREISGKKPYEKIAMLRLIAAFASDACQLERRKDREKLYGKNSFNMETMLEYERKCVSEHGASFDLFDTERPFMAFPYDPSICPEETRVTEMYLHIDLPHGANPIHRTRITAPEYEGSTPAEFLRGLLATYLFPWGNMVKGARTETGANCYITGKKADGTVVYSCSYGSMGINAGKSQNDAPPVLFWPECDTLFHTIVMCMKSRKELKGMSLSDPPAPWNSPRKAEPHKGKHGEEAEKISYVSALTFRSRYVVPVVENGRIKECYLTNGYTVPHGTEIWHDPFVAWTVNIKTSKMVSLKPDLSRAMWRNIGNLTASSEEDGRIMPEVLKPLAKCTETGKLKSIHSMGLIPKKNNAGYDALAADDTLQIPEVFLTNEELGKYLEKTVKAVEKTAECWRHLSISSLYGGNSKYGGKYMDTAVSNYWNRMHYFFFSEDFRFLERIPEEYEKDQAGYEKTLDAEISEYMAESAKSICDITIAEAGTWKSIKTLTIATEKCLEDFYKTKNRFFRKEKKSQ